MEIFSLIRKADLLLRKIVKMYRELYQQVYFKTFNNYYVEQQIQNHLSILEINH